MIKRNDFLHSLAGFSVQCMEETMRILLVGEVANHRARLASHLPFPAHLSAVPAPASEDLAFAAVGRRRRAALLSFPLPRARLADVVRALS